MRSIAAFVTVIAIAALEAQQPAPQGGRGRGAAPPPPATHKLLFLTHAGLYKPSGPTSRARR